MTEAEWLVSTNPAAMLSYLYAVTDSVYGHSAEYGRKPSNRKLRLFGCACCLINGSSLETVDGYELRGGPAYTSEEPDDACADDQWARSWAIPSTNRKLTQAVKANLLRDIVGNPFQPLPYSWLNGHLYEHTPVAPQPPRTHVYSVPWLTDLVVSLAQAVYDERNPDGTFCVDRLAVLSDALEDAGCADEAILRHLRGEERPEGCGVPCEDLECRPCGVKLWRQDANEVCRKKQGPHVRGCHVLDALLGKE